MDQLLYTIAFGFVPWCLLSCSFCTLIALLTLSFFFLFVCFFFPLSLNFKMLSLLDFYKKKKKISQFFFCLLCLEYFLYPLLAAQHHVDGRQLFIYSFFLLKLILFLFSTNSNMKISRKTRPEDGRNPTLLECFQLVLYRFWFFSVGTAFYKEKFFE